MTLRSLRDELHRGDERALADRQSIRASTDRLAELLDDGTISAAVFDWVWRQEPDEEALRTPMVATLWASQLRRYVRSPETIGVDLDALATYRCRGGCRDTGFIERRDEHGEWVVKPCRECRPGPYRMWLDHWRHPGHSCDECDGSRRNGRAYNGARGAEREEPERSNYDPLEGLQ